jgi:hypothetical protein
VNLTAINSGASDEATMISADGLTLMVQSGRSGSQSLDTWTATRSSTGEAFGAPTLGPGEINSSSQDQATWMSPDGRRLYQSSDRGSGGWSLYLSERDCL